MSLIQQYMIQILNFIAYLIGIWWLLALAYKEYPDIRDYLPSFLLKQYAFLNRPYPLSIVIWSTAITVILIYNIGEALHWVIYGY